MFVVLVRIRPAPVDLDATKNNLDEAPGQVERHHSVVRVQVDLGGQAEIAHQLERRSRGGVTVQVGDDLQAQRDEKDRRGYQVSRGGKDLEK